MVERWCPHSKRRIDLFGVIDVVSLGAGLGCVGIQCCTMSGRSEHLKKIKESAGAAAWLEAGCFLELWAWRKILNKRGGKAFKWTPHITNIGEEDLDG